MSMEALQIVPLEPEDIQRTEQYRRQKLTAVLAVLFTDIASSTALREELGEVDYERMREEHDSTVAKIIEGDKAGAVVKSTGDGVLAVFSEPSAAVERALQIQETMREHPYLKLRIGIDMGQVSKETEGGVVKDVFGRHVNRAARIQSLAEPDHVLASFQVYDCAVGWLRSPNIKWKNHGLAPLKGFAEPISVHEPFNPHTTQPQSVDVAVLIPKAPVAPKVTRSLPVAPGYREKPEPKYRPLESITSLPPVARPARVLRTIAVTSAIGLVIMGIILSNMLWMGDGDAGTGAIVGVIIALVVVGVIIALTRKKVEMQFPETVLYGTVVQGTGGSQDNLLSAPPGDPVEFYQNEIRRVVEIELGSIRLSSPLAPQPGSILWVDDHPENNTFFHGILESAGCKVDIALTTAEAQTRLREHRYRVIISDMGRGDNPAAGLELLEWLKKKRIKTPTIIFTLSQSVLQYGEQAKQLGAVRCTAGAISLLDAINSSLIVE